LQLVPITARRVSLLFCTTDRSSGRLMGLNLQTPLYIGGVDQSSVRVSADVSVERGFTGCISQVTYLFRDCLLSPVLHFAALIARVGNLNH